MSGRLVVLPDEDAWASARSEAMRSGPPVVEEVARAAAGTTYAVLVTDEESAQRAALAALGGADVLLCLRAEEAIADRLLGDLERLGMVRTEPSALTPDQRALLTRLQAGQPLGTAAAALHLSRRTADRRLAAARAALGVRTTAEALVAAGRLGLLDTEA